MKPELSRAQRRRLDETAGTPQGREFARALAALVGAQWLRDDHFDACQLCDGDDLCATGERLVTVEFGARERARKAGAS